MRRFGAAVRTAFRRLAAGLPVGGGPRAATEPEGPITGETGAERTAAPRAVARCGPDAA